MLFSRAVTRRPLARRLRLDEMECRLTPATAVAIDDVPLTGPEGTAISLTATVTDPVAPTFAWSVTKDGSPFATGTDPNFSFTPDDNGSYVVSLTVTDEAATFTDSETFTIANVAPTATLIAPAATVPGFPASFTLGATDPSTVDAAAGFTFNIDWDNNGTVDETVTGPSGTVVTHTFDSTGSNTVSLTATDKDGGTSAPVTASLAVETAAVIDDPLDPGSDLLAVGGTAGNDIIKLIPAGNSGRVRVMVNGVSEGTFGPVDRIAVLGLDGNDSIHLAGSIRTSAWLDGGDGNDQLKSAKGNDVLRGGAGNDHINGGQGADVLIGGEDADRILGGPGHDLMIGGTTSYDADDAALFAIADIWTGSGSVADRVESLRDSADFPLVLDGSSATVFDDGAIDRLTGASGLAWFFADPTQDIITGNLKGTFVNDAVPGNGNGNGNGGGGGNGNGNGKPNGNGNGNGHGNGNGK